MVLMSSRRPQLHKWAALPKDPFRLFVLLLRDIDSVNHSPNQTVQLGKSGSRKVTAISPVEITCGAQHSEIAVSRSEPPRRHLQPTLSPDSRHKIAIWPAMQLQLSMLDTFWYCGIRSPNYCGHLP